MLLELTPHLINEETIDISCSIMDLIINSSSEPFNLFDYDQFFDLINEKNENAIIHLLIQFHLKCNSKISKKLFTLLNKKQEIIDDTWNLLKMMLLKNIYQKTKDINKLFDLSKKQNAKTVSLSFIKFYKILIFKNSNKYFIDPIKNCPVDDLHHSFRIFTNSISGLDLIFNIYLNNEDEKNISSSKKFLLKIFDRWNNNSVKYDCSVSSMLNSSVDQFLKIPMIYCKESMSKYQQRFSSICQSKPMFGRLIEEIPDKIVDYAMSFGTNENEAREFSNTMIMGMKNIVQEKNDISDNINYPFSLLKKLKEIEENNQAMLKENFSNKEKLRIESRQALCNFVEQESLKKMKFEPFNLFDY